jgi:hypothetical protein
VQRATVTAALAASLLFAGPARAQLSSSSLDIVAFPILGPGSPVVDGWFSCVVQLTNHGDSAASGTVELVNQRAWVRDSRQSITQAPFSVPPRGKVTLELPSRGFHGVPPSLVARVLDDSGTRIKEHNLPDLHPLEPLLFDLDVPSRVAPALRGLGVPAPPGPSYMRYGAPQLVVSNPQINAQTGDPMLPARPAGYASVTVLLARSDTLAKVGAAELEALGNWVLAGGALAVTVTRPEDLRGGFLKTLAGSEITKVAPPTALAAATRFLVPQQAAGSASPHGGTLTTRVLGPSRQVAGELAGYSGGNLHESRWGASASYGLGELHLLAFDTMRESSTSDEWVKLKLVDLVAHAWQRRQLIALPHAQTALDSSQVDEIRRQLDPNEGTRWTIAVSALLLLIYAVLAGPLNFYLAAKKGRPLRALWILPIWSAVAFVSIVVLGFVGKGVFGRVRRLTLVEAGAGMPRAAATRFRGFFAGSADALTVRGTDRISVLDITGDDETTDRRLLIDRDGPRLEKFRAKPWQAVVVREDGFIGLGGGVSMVSAPGGDVAIKNRLARDLIGVVVKLPDKAPVFFSKLKDGQTALASQGEPLTSTIVSSAFPGSARPHKLEADSFSDKLNSSSVGLGDAWQALESLSSDIDWWPSDAPVLIAQVDGGEGRTADSGMRVEIDRVVIRVVGWGGVS